MAANKFLSVAFINVFNFVIRNTTWSFIPFAQINIRCFPLSRLSSRCSVEFSKLSFFHDATKKLYTLFLDFINIICFYFL